MSEQIPRVEDKTLGQVLRETAIRFPQCEAMVFSSLDSHGNPLDSVSRDCFRLTYREMDFAVDEVARALLGLGIEKGEHVAVWSTNWPRWVLLQFATARIGAVMVTVNPAYRASELAYVIEQSDAVALFLTHTFRKSDYFQLAQEAIPELLNHSEETLQKSLAVEKYPKLRHTISMTSESSYGIPNWETFKALAENVPQTTLDEASRSLQPSEPINIQYTSGTTGFPKGAMLSHRNLLLNAYYIGECQKFSESDRICIPVPFYHCFGCVLGVLSAVVHGATMVIPAEYFHPQATLSSIETERATAIYGVPTMFIAMLEHSDCERRDLSSLRTGIMAGSPCPVEVMNKVIHEMGASEITIGYGLTEASPIITQTRTDDPIDLRVQTVGKPLPGFEVKLVNPETGDELPHEQQGELCARGHGVMLGYYNNPQATAMAIDADGWLHSGDLAMRQSNGYYRITGRMKDMICRGGENIYPREIEEFLYQHPAIETVAVVGVPDPKFQEELAACLKLRKGETLSEEDLREFCEGNLAHYKIPRYIRFVTEFPQTVTGKIQKFKLRKLMVEELGM